MNRRDFIKFLLTTPIAARLDVEQILWVPGKTIFLPSQGLSLTEILEIERSRILPKIQRLFEQDDLFYKILKQRTYDNSNSNISGRRMSVPLHIK